jgi:myosin heavy subunit
VEQGEGERNFHVFYYLFADQEERERLKLTVGGKPSEDWMETLGDSSVGVVGTQAIPQFGRCPMGR